MHPIEHFFLNKPTKNYIETTVQCVIDIHNNSNENGDILVFMPGKSEIHQVIRNIEMKLEKEKEKNKKNNQQLKLYPLYSKLERQAQQNAINKNSDPSHIRKCVVSTNIAEISLTIPDIVFVIDCGLSKQTSYDPTSGIEALSIQPISKASVKQRQGRAGRVKKGKIYHLYTQKGYANLQNETPAEIVRSSLINETLTMLALGIKNPVYFDYIDAPDAMTLGRAITVLKQLQCIDNNGNITQIGRNIAQFPLSPTIAKSILTAMDNNKYNCLNEILSIASMLEIQEKLWLPPPTKNNDNNINSNHNNDIKNKERVRKSRAKFAHVRGDHLTLLNVYFAYMNVKLSTNNDIKKLKDFCREFCLNYKALERALDIKQQLEDIVYRIALKNGKGEKIGNNNNNNNDTLISFKVNDHTHKEYYNNILKCLLSGHFLNLACLRDKQKYWIYRVCEMDEKTSTIDFVEKATVDTQSVFSKQTRNQKNMGKQFQPNWVFFDKVLKDSIWLKIRIVSSIQPLWILETANHYFNLEQLKEDESCVAQALKELHAP